MFNYKIKPLLYYSIILIFSINKAYGQGSWFEYHTGSYHDLNDIYFHNELHGWVVGNNSLVFETFNGGLSWQEVICNTDKNIEAIDFVDEENGWLGTRGAYPYVGEIYYYNGSNWTPQYTPPYDEDGIIMSIDMINNSDGWACGDDIFHYDGNGWQPISLGIGTYLYDIFFVNSNTGWAVGDDGRLFKYSNSYWQEIEMGLPSYFALSGVHFISTSKGWTVGGAGTVKYSEDGGNSWIDQETPIDTDLDDVFFVNESNGWAVGDYGYVIHYDGTEWEIVETGFTDDLTAVFFIDNNTGWVVGENGNVYKYVLPYTVDLSSEPQNGGSTTGGGDYYSGNNVTVEASPNEGWGFLSWTNPEGDVLSTNATYSFSMPSNDLELTANFEMIDYNVTVVAEPEEGGSVTGGGIYNYGNEVIVEAQQSEGFTFDGWTDSNGNLLSTEPSYSFLMPDNDLGLTANFDFGTRVIRNHSDNLIVYPNPSNGVVFIINSYNTLKSYSITVYNSSGERVVPVKIRLFRDKVKIDISNLIPGIYHLQLANDNSIVYKKIILI